MWRAAHRGSPGERRAVADGEIDLYNAGSTAVDVDIDLLGDYTSNSVG
ncbi:hypothetical protein HZZ00_19720 [Streptomyces sp. NEAU-sy36]|nr:MULTISPECIES: hypothetical protein [unclassified Streptomyces]QLJ02993.1 hypothetical protein HZZ00_19720 [Streptomyces sp. NEAU-sy36]